MGRILNPRPFYAINVDNVRYQKVAVGHVQAIISLKETDMSKILRDAGNGRELVLTNDKVNPFAVRLDGTVVTQPWSRDLMDRLLDDDAFIAAAGRELDKL